MGALPFTAGLRHALRASLQPPKLARQRVPPYGTAYHAMRQAASTLDYRELARRRLPHFLFEYIDGGSYAEVTLKRNVDDLAAIALRQRILRDVSALDLSTKLFG